MLDLLNRNLKLGNVSLCIGCVVWAAEMHYPHITTNLQALLIYTIYELLTVLACLRKGASIQD